MATCLIVARIWQRLQQPDMIELRDANIALNTTTTPTIFPIKGAGARETVLLPLDARC